MNEYHPTSHLIGPLHKTDNFFNLKGVFFAPIRNKEECAYRSAAVVTGPLIFTAAGIFTFVLGTIELLKATKDMCTGNFSDAKKELNTAGKFCLRSATFILLAPLTIMINLIDLIGAAIKQLMPEATPKQESPIFTSSR